MAIENDPTTEFDMDLENQSFRIVMTGEEVKFEIYPFKKNCLMQGMDELDYLLSLDKEICKFEAQQIIY